MSFCKIILSYFKKHKIRLGFVVISILLVTIISLLPAQILKIIVDEVIPSENINKLFKIALIYLLTYILIGIITFIKDIIMLNTSLRITEYLKCKMMKHINKMSYKALVNTDSGTLESYFNNDVNSINELFTSGVVSMITDLFKMIGIVISIFIFSNIFGYIVLLILPILILFTSFIRKRMLKAQLKTKSLEGNVNKILLENVENINQIKINKAFNYSKDKYDVILNNHFKANQASNLYDAIFSPIMVMIRHIVVCVVLLVSGMDANIFKMSIGAVIAAISLLTDLFSPIENLGMEIQTIQKSVASVKRINEFLKLEEDENKKYYELDNYNIIFDNVSFSYNDVNVISNFNLNIDSNDKIALQGSSGSGKSTLMKLALGLIKPNSGSVTINSIPSYSLDESTRRNLFAIVYQEPFFSGGTIYEEISLKDKAISKDSVRKALDIVGLNYICDLDVILAINEYSSGELALFNIARIIVKDPKVIFLDEMNAKIDPVTAKNLINLINTISKDKIVISINHYGDILDNARIIKLI